MIYNCLQNFCLESIHKSKQEEISIGNIFLEETTCIFCNAHITKHISERLVEEKK